MDLPYIVAGAVFPQLENLAAVRAAALTAGDGVRFTSDGNISGSTVVLALAVRDALTGRKPK